jgi:activating signal cointegrator complex subunit 3
MPEEDAMDLAGTMKDTALQHTLAFGIGIHHAGLCERDRSTVEELFCGGKMQVLVCTSTLAWGVNFPAHLVIIKGTEYFDGKLSRYVVFPITDVLQMMGRAGRPQFDTHGVAVIMVHEPKKNFYRKFLYEPFPVVSHLHEVLADHINAEVASGTIRSVQDTMDYLTWTYFFRRLVQNPAYYQLNDTAPAAVKLHLQELVCDTLLRLADAGCLELPDDFDAQVQLTKGGSGCRLADIPVVSTTLGSICSYYYLKHATVGTFSSRFESEEDVLCGPLDAALPALTKLLCDAAEFDEVPVRHNEDQLNAQLAAVVPWQKATAAMSGSMDDPHVKAFLLLQAHMARLPLPIADYVNDTKSVMDQAARVLNSMIDIAADAGYMPVVLRLMLLNQCIVQARVPGGHTLLQIPHMTQGGIVALQKRFGGSATALATGRGLVASVGSATPPRVPGHLGAVSLGEIAAQKIVHVESALSQGSAVGRRTAQVLVQAIAAVPLLDVEFSVKFGGRETRIPVRGGGGTSRWEVPSFDEEEEDAEATLDLKVRLRVANARQASKTVRGGRNGKPRDFGWWLAVGAGSAMGEQEGQPEELLALKRVRVPFHGRWSEQKLCVPCPATEGDVAMQLYVVCDGISGTDQQFAVPLRAVPVAEFMPVGGGKKGSAKAPAAVSGFGRPISPPPVPIKGQQHRPAGDEDGGNSDADEGEDGGTESVAMRWA